MKRNKLLLVLLAGILLVGASCSKDETPGDPTGTVTLNMLDESNGKTILAGIFINKANNFFVNDGSTQIADLGIKGGIGVSMAPKFDNLTNQAAVSPGHLYQIFESSTLKKFQSGTMAISVGSSYRRIYVVSPFSQADKVVGAVVKHVLVSPDKRGLPDRGYILGDVRNYGEYVEMKLPKGAECQWEENDRFDIEVENGVLRITLTDTLASVGVYPVNIRVGDVYTTVLVNVV